MSAAWYVQEFTNSDVLQDQYKEKGPNKYKFTRDPVPIPMSKGPRVTWTQPIPGQESFPPCFLPPHRTLKMQTHAGKPHHTYPHPRYNRFAAVLTP